MKKLEKEKKVKKIKNKKSKRSYSKGEFIFNLVSLVLVIGIGLYFGGRSFYYFSKQNVSMELAQTTLNGSITTNNEIVTTGDGLHKDNDGYFYKGQVMNNYVQFANRLFRVIRVNNDGSIKVVTDDIVSEFMWGDTEGYADSNLNTWLDKNEANDLTGVYYDTIPNQKDFLVKTNYTIDTFDGKKVTAGKNNYESYVTTLSIKDYIQANGKNSYLNNNKYFWILGNENSADKMYIDDTGALMNASLYEAYGVRAVLTLKADTDIFGGTGTKEDPYKVNQKKKTNYVDGYVQFENDLWKVYYDKNGVLKLAYNSISNNMVYSRKTSLFNPRERGNVGNYLNNDLLNPLPYKNYFQDFNVYTGEVSSNTSLNYQNIYSESTAVKMGLLNAFDYINITTDDFYLGNTLSTVGSMVYVYHTNGLLEEVKVSDAKNIVPTISISKDIIKSGSGTLTDPYKVG